MFFCNNLVSNYIINFEFSKFGRLILMTFLNIAKFLNRSESIILLCVVEMLWIFTVEFKCFNFFFIYNLMALLYDYHMR